LDLQGTDPEIGILYVFAMVSIGVYGIMLGGWASNNKFALLGAIRAASQMVSYELAMGLSIVALVMMTGTLSLGGIVDYQVEHGWNVILPTAWASSSSSSAPSRRPTAHLSTCRNARRNWWAATTPSSAA
jgi:NADH:ubiquinone oxidoreductase subunit H